MKKSLLFIVFNLVMGYAHAQWEWTKRIGGDDYDFVGNIDTDGDGNIYITGSTEFYTTLFLAKYDPSGILHWIKTLPGGSQILAYDITVDFKGSVYITGRYNGTITFDSITLNKYDHGSAFFLAKYDSEGNIIWAKGYDGNLDDFGNSVSTDQRGNVYVGGGFSSSSLTFDNIKINNASKDNRDVFLAKFDMNGKVLWVKSAGGTSYDDITSIIADAFGNVYMTGGFGSSSISFGTYILSASAYKGVSWNICNMFIVKYDTFGNVIWAKSADKTNHVYGSSIALDALGNIYVAGTFESDKLDLGSITIINSSGGNVLYAADFTAKFDKNGSVIWIKRFESRYRSEASAVDTDMYGNIYTSGAVADSISNFYDMVIVKYDPQGNILFLKKAEGRNNYGKSLAADWGGNVYVSGSFWNDSILLTPHVLYNKGRGDLFFAKLGIEKEISTTIFDSEIYKIEIYPNPSSGIFTIGIQSKSNKVKVCVYNLLGSCVREETFAQRVNEVNIQDQPKGIYFVEIFADEKKEIKKIIICNN